MPEILKILFVINPGSGTKQKRNWKEIISDYFRELPHQVSFFVLTGSDDDKMIKERISEFSPDRVIAVGGDGTVSLVGKLMIGGDVPLGILPGGSANGMASELKIPSNPQKALEVITTGKVVFCDTIKINDDDMVFHLADLGLNARLIRYFDESRFRGMWTYARMLIKALVNKRLMRVHVKADGLDETMAAYMIVIGNASKYGTGAVINPEGVTDDGIFELIVVRRIAFSEFVKLFWSYKSFDPRSVEIFETTRAEISSRHGVQFQIDGEYKGKIRDLKAVIVPDALKVIVPAASSGE